MGVGTAPAVHEYTGTRASRRRGRSMRQSHEAMFRHLGIEPAAMKTLALKSSVHFRADIQPIAEAVLAAAADGPNPVDRRKLAYRHLRAGPQADADGTGFRRVSVRL